MSMISEKILLDSGQMYCINMINNIEWQDDADGSMGPDKAATLVAANALSCRAANALLLLPLLLLLCGRAASSAVSPRVTHPRPMTRVHMSLCVRGT
jgi:hypothetical protein